MELNLLHINIKKCCYMYFSPYKRVKESYDDDIDDYLAIGSKIIRRVTQTKFLGVIIDDKLNWEPHLESLNKKLKSACGRIYRIKNFLPQVLHKQIYHTLFESHLSFAISVWGGVSNNRLKPIFLTQKKCIRIMFGDTKRYLEKFCTCARTRQFGMQRLGSEFYTKESTKPLFYRHNLLAVENLYRYRCIMEVFKIIKCKTPVSLYSTFNRSDRKETLFLTPSPTHNFVYKSSWLWNMFLSKVNSHLDFSSSICSMKNVLKQSLLRAQNSYGDNWCDANFTEFSSLPPPAPSLPCSLPPSLPQSLPP